MERKIRGLILSTDEEIDEYVKKEERKIHAFRQLILSGVAAGIYGDKEQRDYIAKDPDQFPPGMMIFSDHV